MTRKRHARPISVLLAPLLVLAACAGSDAPERVVERRPSDAPAARGPLLLHDAMIVGHDRARREAGTPPLVWDDSLAADALVYARTMARTGRFEHADQPQGSGRQGENLWTGTRGAYAYDEMFGHWLAERRDFVDNATPAFSRTGKWQDVAHYTQIIWRTSTRVGCAMASGATDDYLVCRYAPPGNVVGQKTL